MNIDKEVLDNCQVRLTVTVEPERLREEMMKAARRIGQQVVIPGFRRGKVPYHVLLQRFGEAAILEEALEPLTQEVYSEALEAAEITPYAPGTLDDVQQDPLVLTFTVPLPPEIDLGSYRDLRIEYQQKEITDAEVEEALSNVRDQQGTMEAIERPVEMGDVVLLDILAVRAARPAEAESDEEGEDDIWLDRKGVRVKIAEDATYPVPGFPAQVVGMQAGEQRSFDISFAEDDEEIDESLRGQTLHFEVTCHTVFEHTLPELDDDLARAVGDFETLDDLRKAIRQELENGVVEEAEQDYYDQIMSSLLGGIVSIKYPPFMLEEQIDEMIDNLKATLGRAGLNVEEYLRLQNMTMEQLREDFREEAERDLKKALILGKLIGEEKLTISEEEIDAYLLEMARALGGDETLAENLKKSMRTDVEGRLLARKGVRRLIAIAKGEAPEIGAQESAAEEAPAAEAAEDAPAEEPAAEAEAPEIGAEESAAEEAPVAEAAEDAPAEEPAAETGADESSEPGDPANRG
ncbi:MAG: trigger factor [Anaerolineae bacterium]